MYQDNVFRLGRISVKHTCQHCT